MNCIECQSKIKETVSKKDREFYICEKGHRNQRMIDNEGFKITEEKGEIIHHSVGIIVTYENQLLFLKRRKYPTKFSIPAGHLEEGEDPDQAVLRELYEETGIENAENVEKLFEKTLDDKCRRGSDRHHWHLYLTQFEDKPDTRVNEEAEFLEWSREPLDLDLTDVVDRILRDHLDLEEVLS